MLNGWLEIFEKTIAEIFSGDEIFNTTFKMTSQVGGI